MENLDYLGPKRGEIQFDMTEGIKKHFPHVLKKTLKGDDNCDCGNCDATPPPVGCKNIKHVPGSKENLENFELNEE